MPAVANIKSQIKRNGTNTKARLRNNAVKSEVKTRVKTAVRTAEDSDLRTAVKRIDKAASLGVIHKNQASNRKGRLMRRVGRIQAARAQTADS